MEKIKEDIETKEEIKETNALILYNDPVNTFQEVIISLMTVLGWNPIQSEQVATIAHHNGKCKLKEGDYLDLVIIKYQFDELNLTTEVE